jgi:hypothetical protein
VKNLNARPMTLLLLLAACGGPSGPADDAEQEASLGESSVITSLTPELRHCNLEPDVGTPQAEGFAQFGDDHRFQTAMISVFADPKHVRKQVGGTVKRLEFFALIPDGHDDQHPRWRTVELPLADVKRLTHCASGYQPMDWYNAQIWPDAEPNGREGEMSSFAIGVRIVRPQGKVETRWLQRPGENFPLPIASHDG